MDFNILLSVFVIISLICSLYQGYSMNRVSHEISKLCIKIEVQITKQSTVENDLQKTDKALEDYKHDMKEVVQRITDDIEDLWDRQEKLRYAFSDHATEQSTKEIYCKPIHNEENQRTKRY